MVTSTLQAVLLVLVGVPFVCLLLGLMMALFTAATGGGSKARLRGDWEAKVREHGKPKALLRATLENAVGIGLLMIGAGLVGLVSRACSRAGS